jgi:hypothetical protein
VAILGLARPSFSVFYSGPQGLGQYLFGSLQENSLYWGSLAIADIPQKIVYAGVVFAGAFGLSLIAMVMGISKKHAVVAVAAAIPVIYYLGNTMDLTVHHLSLAVPFLGILAGLGVSRVWLHPAIIMVPSAVFLILFPVTYNLGNSIDEHLSGAEFYKSLDGVSDGSIIVSLNVYKDGMFISGRENTFVLIHNKRTDKVLVPVSQTYFSDLSLPGYESVGEAYRKKLQDDYGISTPLVYDKEKDRQENLWDNMALLKEANPDRSVYYIRIDEDDTLRRVLEEYQP